MSAHKSSLYWGLLVAAGLVLVVAFIILNASRENTSSVLATPESPPLLVIPSLLPPPHTDGREFFPEYVLERYAYDPASYPQYAEVLPEAPCATWENGGLTWSFFEDIPSAKLGWGASVWLPIYRFCGFPLPYPQKPTQTKIENAPREWVIWKSTQMAGTPTPEPTSSP